MFLLFVLAVYGATSILLYGRIFDFIRPDYKFFHCSQCVGFHMACLIYTMFFFLDWELAYWPETLIDFGIAMILFGWIGSGTTYLIDRIVHDDGIRLSMSKGSEEDS